MKIKNDSFKIDWDLLSAHAWQNRDNALSHDTKVGAALITNTGNLYSGCNIEQRFRNKDIHAEVCAISKMISNGEKKLVAILIVAERERFTPCGTCMDWIFQFGGESCYVGYQTKKKGEIKLFIAKEIMPFYPK